MRSIASLITPWKELVVLAGPVVISQLGMMTMILVDTYFVGHLGNNALAGLGIGNSVFTSVVLFSASSMAGLEVMSAQAFGRKNKEEAREWLWQALCLACFVSLLLTPLAFVASFIFETLGIEKNVAIEASLFLKFIGLSLLPTTLFVVIRQYLASQNLVGFTTWVVILANFINALFNFILVPSFGVKGSAIATTLVRGLMVFALGFYLLKKFPDSLLPAPIDKIKIRLLWKLGFPFGLQTLSRSFVFTVVSLLMGVLGATPSAAHSVALNVGSFFYMIPIAISTASCILVAHSLGSSSPQLAKEKGKDSLWFAFVQSTLMAIVLIGFRFPISKIFSTSESVQNLTAQLILWVASFQILDGVQTVAAGVLRGFSDTRTSAHIQMFCLWIIGLPVGSYLCFVSEKGAMGMWGGLSLGLLISGALIVMACSAVIASEAKQSRRTDLYTRLLRFARND